MKYALLIAGFFCTGFLAQANVTLPKIFGANMVLQRGKPIPVWGWAAPGERVEIRFHNQTKKTKAANDGSWKIWLAEETAGGPYTLTASGKNNITLANILVGDVWLCSGQSNMEMQVMYSQNAAQEIAGAYYPHIRQLGVARTIAQNPANDIAGGTWEEASPATVGNFTAVGYFFARRLYNQLQVPIGIINASRGGSVVETWMSRGTLEKSSEFYNAFKEVTFNDLETRNENLFQNRMQQFGVAPDDTTNAVTNLGGISVTESSWKTMKLPADFDHNGLKDFDGVIWFRKTINLTKEDAAKAAVLHLSTIDDGDITYVNGQQVGSSSSYDINRQYALAPGLLKEGENVIAIRLFDNSGNGGLFGKDEDLHLSFDDKMLPLAGNWRYKIEAVKKELFNPNEYPSLLYNGMIHPLLPFAIKGILWYQGESNAGRAYQYRTAFPMLIRDWRQQFKQGDLPFYFVQIASFDTNPKGTEKSTDWAELREAQTLALSVPNTGMAVAFDVGETLDIHPKNKEAVGLRLAAIALDHLYGQKQPYSGPMYASMQVQGRNAVLSFSHADSGWLVKDPYQYIKGFSIAGANRKFYLAQATIEGHNIVVHSDSVLAPVAVRYAWANDMPEANLYNKEGFPAVPFRTDAWPGITVNEKFIVTK